MRRQGGGSGTGGVRTGLTGRFPARGGQRGLALGGQHVGRQVSKVVKIYICASAIYFLSRNGDFIDVADAARFHEPSQMGPTIPYQKNLVIAFFVIRACGITCLTILTPPASRNRSSI